MQVKEILALVVIVSFTTLLVYPIFFGYIGDVIFHAALIFEVAMPIIVVMFFGSVIDELVNG